MFRHKFGIDDDEFDFVFGMKSCERYVVTIYIIRYCFCVRTADPPIAAIRGGKVAISFFGQDPGVEIRDFGHPFNVVGGVGGREGGDLIAYVELTDATVTMPERVVNLIEKGFVSIWAGKCAHVVLTEADAFIFDEFNVMGCKGLEECAGGLLLRMEDAVFDILDGLSGDVGGFGEFDPGPAQQGACRPQLISRKHAVMPMQSGR